MKKGFTLFELLAVIIIMAIVALVVTPLFLDIETKEYNKVICNIDGETKQMYIDKIIRNTDTVITFKSDGKKYEFSKNVCYLVKE